MIDVDHAHELSREAVRIVATRLFGELGYHETSLTRLADAAGVPPEVLRGMFRGKADILGSGLAERCDRLVASLRELRGAGPLPETLLEAMRSINDFPVEFQEDMAEGWEVLDRTPELDALRQEAYARYRFALVRFIAEEIGQSPADLTPRLVGETVFKASTVTTRDWVDTRGVSISMGDAVAASIAPILAAYTPLLERERRSSVPAISA